MGMMFTNNAPAAKVLGDSFPDFMNSLQLVGSGTIREVHFDKHGKGLQMTVFFTKKVKKLTQKLVRTMELIMKNHLEGFNVEMNGKSDGCSMSFVVGK